MFEDLEPRPARGAPLTALTREDLDGYSVEDLKERIASLEAEVARSQSAICLQRMCQTRNGGKPPSPGN